MITVDRTQAKEFVQTLLDRVDLTREVTEADINLFIEYIDVYAFSEQMLDDYCEELR